MTSSYAKWLSILLFVVVGTINQHYMARKETEWCLTNVIN